MSFLLTLELHSQLGQTKSKIVQRHALKRTFSAAPDDCFSQCSDCAKQSGQSIIKLGCKLLYKSEKKISSKEGFRLDCSYLALPWKDKRKRLAELGADSFGKLWAEVDKDIRAVANTHWQKVDVGFYPYKYGVSEYFKQVGRGRTKMDIRTKKMKRTRFKNQVIRMAWVFIMEVIMRLHICVLSRCNRRHHLLRPWGWVTSLGMKCNIDQQAGNCNTAQ